MANGESLTRAAYQRVRADLLACRLKPGARISISELAADLEVSAGAVREALARLTAEGLVVAEPLRGFRAVEVSASDLRDLTAVRAQIEQLCVRSSIARGDVSWESRLVAAHHALSRAPEREPHGRGPPRRRVVGHPPRLSRSTRLRLRQPISAGNPRDALRAEREVPAAVRSALLSATRHRGRASRSRGRGARARRRPRRGAPRSAPGEDLGDPHRRALHQRPRYQQGGRRERTRCGRASSPNLRCVSAAILSDEQEALCARMSPRGGERFAGVEHGPAPSGAPILAGVVAWFDSVSRPRLDR